MEVANIFNDYAKRLQVNSKLTQQSAKNILIHSIRKAQANINDHAAKAAALFAYKVKFLFL